MAYLDYTGSGVGTVAHLRENGRIVLMFCAFEGPPKVVRLHGRGVPVLAGEQRFGELLTAFDAAPGPGLRSVVEVTVTRVSDSCGYGVPLMAYAADRDLLPRYLGRKTPAELVECRATRNATSIDGQAVFS